MASKKDEPSICKFETEEDVAVGLATYISNLSDKFIKDKDSFTVVLSGGSLISTMRKLIDYKNSIPWSKWFIFWLDERVVPLNDTDSNYKLAYDGLLSKVPIPHSNIFHITEDLLPAAAAADYEAKLKRLVEKKLLKLSDDGKYPIFDLMLLGVGPDGHVASLFPWLYQRYETESWITFVNDSPKPPPPRISMTFPVINWASEIAIVVTGSYAANVVNVALGKHTNNYLPLPVQDVSPVNGHLTWMLDNDAASKL